MTVFPFSSTDLPSDKDTLQLMVLALLEERDQQKRRAEEQKELTEVQQRRAEAHSRQAAALQVELLRVKLELDRYKKWYYDPRADWLQSDKDVAQMLLNFAEELDCKPGQGFIFTKVTPTRSSPEFADFLLGIAEHYSAAHTIHLVMDNLSSHTRKASVDRFGEADGGWLWERFTLHTTSPSMEAG